ncbi:ABC transporter permease [Candidatus Woesearchaeota archaeon]|nr:ABC transporter permease [Candidatus Woesearchaeota archaeon]
MNDVWVLMQKNVRVLLRARASALIVMLGPVLVIFLAGLAFDNTNAYAVKIGAYSGAYNGLSESFMERLVNAQFQVERYSDEEHCVTAIKEGVIHTCLVFSPQFELNKNASNEITFYVDYSRLNLVWTVLSTMTSRISSRNQELSRNLTAQVLSALELTKRSLADRKSSLSRLVTKNDETSRLVADVRVKVEELDFAVDPNEIGTTEMANYKDRVKHWVDNSLTIADSSLTKSRNFIELAQALVKGSSAANDLKDSLQKYMKETVSDLGELQARFQTTQEVLKEEFVAYDDLLSNVIGSMTQLKARMDAASRVRDESVKDLDQVKLLLDASLIELLTVQKTLNDVERAVSSVEVTDTETIVSPITTTIKPLVAEKSYLNYLFPTLIVLVVMFTGLLLTPLLMILEKNSPAALRNDLTPTSPVSHHLATFLTSGGILALQLFVILVIASTFFTTPLTQNFASILVAGLLLVSCFTLLGMVLGVVFVSEATANLSAVSLSSLLLVASNAIIPLETMPSWLAWAMSANPFVLGYELLRKTVVFQFSLARVWFEVGILLIYCMIFIGVIVVLQERLRKKYFGLIKRHA